MKEALSVDAIRQKANSLRRDARAITAGADRIDVSSLVNRFVQAPIWPGDMRSCAGTEEDGRSSNSCSPIMLGNRRGLKRKALTLLVVAIGLLPALLPHSPCFAGQTAAPAQNEESDEALADQVNDPTSRLTQFQIKDIDTPAQYGTNAQLNTLQIRPIFAIRAFSVIPLEQLIRPTIKVVTVPAGKGASTSTAFDDMQLLELFVVPWPSAGDTGFRWGVGPYFVLPTSNSELTGKDAWQVGPAGAFAYQAFPGLKISGLLQQAISFAYTSPKSTPVSSLTFQPILSYQLGNGWYLKSSDATWTLNLRHKTSTTMPLSAGFGKVWKLAKGYSIDTSGSGEWTVYRQFADQTEQFTLNFQVTLLLPELEL
jgi:hypothetical protein